MNPGLKNNTHSIEFQVWALLQEMDLSLLTFSLRVSSCHQCSWTAAQATPACLARPSMDTAFLSLTQGMLGDDGHLVRKQRVSKPERI